MIQEVLVAARIELSKKTHEQLDLETAIKWGARAVAALENYQKNGDLKWLAAAIGYRHEALEHAAGGPPGAVEQIRAELGELTGGIFR
jgi:hypothetical protein